MEISELGPGDVHRVMTAGGLFDAEPRADWTERFLAREGHHMLMALVDAEPVGFVTGIEITHPDKGTEMLLYELGVDEEFRRRGIGRTLVEELKQLARARGCHGMWVPIEAGNDVAVATYASAGFGEPEQGVTMWIELT
jgi:ribosomal protein S18 acetylase RimI-like enzyme